MLGWSGNSSPWRATRAGCLSSPCFEDRLDRSVGPGADVETAVASRFQPGGAVLAAKTKDANAGPIALLGVRPALQD